MSNIFDFEIFEKENDLTTEQILKTIKTPSGKKLQVLDMQKIKKLKHMIFFAFSERGVIAKTYGTKEFAAQEWKSDKKRTLWLRNLKKDLEMERANFLGKDAPPILKDATWLGSVSKNNLTIGDKNKKPFIKFAAVNSAESEKASRVNYDYIVWDEFNVNSNLVQNIVNKFDSILHTSENIIQDYGDISKTKIFIYGNNKSLNHPLFLALKIPYIKNEITSYWLRIKVEEKIIEQPLIVLYYPVRDETYQLDFAKHNARNQKFLLSLLMGTAEHSYFNESLYDNINFVEDKINKITRHLSELEKGTINQLMAVYHKERYYAFMVINKNKVKFNLDTDFHIYELEDKEAIKKATINGEIIAINKNDIIEQIPYANATNIKNRFRKLLATDHISFESVAVRELFISSIKN